ncbi:MAG: ankyrin repeat domain-containing protein [Pseudomonadales bacterium]|jgi:hypothetical protein|nr:ankyrin repeat domain-containing protein [Pseudomonadales bacterium]
MTTQELLNRIAGGRTDLVFELLRCADWRQLLTQGPVTPLDWFVFHDDVTALKAILEASGDLGSLDLQMALHSAAFFGHWKVCDFLLLQGADARHAMAETGETPLHSALCKAGRPHFLRTVRLLLEHGADPNARTVVGAPTESFMRDIRTCGETPLHRAAAYADGDIIDLLLEAGADRTLRDAHGDSPLTWASRHLRPGAILHRLTFPPHKIGPGAITRMTADHGAGFGDGMDWKFVGEYLPESLPPAE